MFRKIIICFAYFIILELSITFGETNRANITVVDSYNYGITNDILNGAFEIKNITDLHEENLFYMLSLVPKKLIDENNMSYSMYTSFNQTEPIKFSLASNETKTIAFAYEIPQKMPQDTYNLVVRFMDKTSELIANIVIDEFMLGEKSWGIVPDNYKEISYYKIKGFEGALSGPYFNIGKSPEAYINVKSLFENDVKLTPKYTIYKRLPSFNSEPVDIVEGEPFTIKALESKEIKLKLPVIKEPDSYYIKTVLMNENGEIVSGEYYFRYVVNGKSVKISAIAVSYNEENKMLRVNIEYLGSSDTTTLENVTFITEVRNTESEELIDKYVDNLTLYPIAFTTTYSIIVEPETNITISAELVQDNDTLAFEKIDFDKKATSPYKEKFIDLPDNDIARAVKTLNSLGIISGYPDGTFKPENNITRAEFTVIALKLIGIDDITKFNVKSELTDVPDEHWASRAIHLAYVSGIVSGYQDGTFRPNNNVTYSEAITILLNTIGFKKEVATLDEGWPDNYINFANSANLLDGVAISSFNYPATRGDVSIMTLLSYYMRKGA